MSVNTLGSSCCVLSTDPSLSCDCWLMYLLFSYHYHGIVRFQETDFERALRIWESKLQMKIILWFEETFYITNEGYCYNARRWRKVVSKVQVRHLLSTLNKSATIGSWIFQLYSHEHTTLHLVEYLTLVKSMSSKSLCQYTSHTQHTKRFLQEKGLLQC